jgi:hypothetical protein
MKRKELTENQRRNKKEEYIIRKKEKGKQRCGSGAFTQHFSPIFKFPNASISLLQTVVIVNMTVILLQTHEVWLLAT